MDVALHDAVVVARLPAQRERKARAQRRECGLGRRFARVRELAMQRRDRRRAGMLRDRQRKPLFLGAGQAELREVRLDFAVRGVVAHHSPGRM